jgi:hypothetical protein
MSHSGFRKPVELTPAIAIHPHPYPGKRSSGLVVRYRTDVRDVRSRYSEWPPAIPPRLLLSPATVYLVMLLHVPDCAHAIPDTTPDSTSAPGKSSRRCTRSATPRSLVFEDPTLESKSSDRSRRSVHPAIPARNSWVTNRESENSSGSFPAYVAGNCKGINHLPVMGCFQKIPKSIQIYSPSARDGTREAVSVVPGSARPSFCRREIATDKSEQRARFSAPIDCLLQVWL